MTDDLENLRRRQGRLVVRVGRLEVKVEKQANLRAAMDSDLGSLKAAFGAQKAMLQALHDSQQEHTAQLRKIDGRLDKIDGRLDKLEAGQERILAGVETIREMLDRTRDSDD